MSEEYSKIFVSLRPIYLYTVKKYTNFLNTIDIHKEIQYYVPRLRQNHTLTPTYMHSIHEDTNYKERFEIYRRKFKKTFNKYNINDHILSKVYNKMIDNAIIWYEIVNTVNTDTLPLEVYNAISTLALEVTNLMNLVIINGIYVDYEKLKNAFNMDYNLTRNSKNIIINNIVDTLDYMYIVCKMYLLIDEISYVFCVKDEFKENPDVNYMQGFYDYVVGFINNNFCECIRKFKFCDEHDLYRLYVRNDVDDSKNIYEIIDVFVNEPMTLMSFETYALFYIENEIEDKIEDNVTNALKTYLENDRFCDNDGDLKFFYSKINTT